MQWKNIIQSLLAVVLPLIEKFIKSTVIPKMIRKSYERFDAYANDLIESLSELVDKIKATTDEQKKQNHLEGFELGLKTLRAIADKLIEACDTLDKELWDYDKGTPVTEEIPF